LIVALFKLLTIEQLAMFWDRESGNFSIFLVASNEYANTYLYGSFMLPLKDLKKPFESHSATVKVVLIAIHLVQKYQTIISTFHQVLSFVGSYAARNIASSATPDQNNLEVSLLLQIN